MTKYYKFINYIVKRENNIFYILKDNKWEIASFLNSYFYDAAYDFEEILEENIEEERLKK